MALRTFLKIEGINGDSVVPGYEQWVEVQAFSWGVAQPTLASISGKGAVPPGVGTGPGSATFDTLSILKLVDAASPQIALYACDAHDISELHLSQQSSSGSTWEDFSMRFTECVISRYQVSGGDSELPTEEVSFVFNKVEMYEQSQASGPKVGMSWDLASNAGGPA